MANFRPRRRSAFTQYNLQFAIFILQFHRRNRAATPGVTLNINCRKLFQITALSLSLLPSIRARSADWPQWRGPNRDNVWNETGILKSFPAEGLKMRWRVPVGPGWSSPVVVQGRVYLTDMRLEKPRAWERIQCFKESTGKLLWSRESELVYP